MILRGGGAIGRSRSAACLMALALGGLCIAGPFSIALSADVERLHTSEGAFTPLDRLLLGVQDYGLVWAADASRTDSTVRHVDDDAGCAGLTPCYPTIAEAVMDASSGDVIRLAAGTYPESVVVSDKALQFEGPGSGPGAGGSDAASAAVWAAPAGSAYALLVDARNADITATAVSGITFQGGDAGVYISGRRPGSPLGPPPGRPGSGKDTDVGQASVLNSHFEGHSDAAIVVRWVDDVRIEGVQAVRTGVDAVRAIDGGQFALSSSTLGGAGSCVRLIETRPAASRGGIPQIGGSLGISNDLSGCAGLAVVLENRSGDPTPLKDVAAAYNRWGSAWESGIEERILDILDVPEVGRVRWRPAVDSPSNVSFVITPTALVADGVSRAGIEISVDDLAGRPVEDGVVVALTSDVGRLDRSGSRAEAEGPGPGVVTAGDWDTSDNADFGPFDGAGYVSSDQVGASLVWNFQSPAVVARLGSQPTEEAIVQVQVDDRPPEALGLFGAERRWMEHKLASGLGPGPHTITLTVAAGTVAVDAFGAGWLSVGGAVRADLVAPTTTGFASLRADAWGAGGRVGADQALALIPGPPSAMSVTLGAATLGAGGATTTVVVRASDSLGRPVPNGTPVMINATLGTVEPATTAFFEGAANAVFTSGDLLGDALVTATAQGVSGPISATAGLRILPGPPASITLDVERETMTANSRDTARITVRVRDSLGNPVRDGTPITLTASRGSLEGLGGVTVGGVISAVLRAGAVAGTAEILALDPSGSGSAPSASKDVSLVAPDLWVIKRVEPVGVVVPGEVVTYTVTYGNKGPGSVYDVVIDEIIPEGITSTSLSASGPTLGARDGSRYIFDIERIRPGATGEIQVRGRIDPARRWNRTTLVNTVRIEAPSAAEATRSDNTSESIVTVEPSAVYSVTLGAPTSLPVGGATGVLSVRVFDRFGNDAVDGTPVSFSTDLGVIEPALVATVGGRANATFSTGTVAGVASVHVLSLDDRGDSKRITITPGPANGMTLTSSHARLQVAGGRAELMASIADQFGNPVSDTLVIFSTDLGSVAPGAVSTDASGVVTSTLAAGVRSGIANVESRVGTLARGLRLPFDPGPPTRLVMLPPAGVFEIGRSTQVAARLSDALNNPIAGADVSFAFDLGLISPSSAKTGADGIARSAARPSDVGRGRILALSGAFDASLEVDVRRPEILLPYLLTSGSHH